MTATDLETLRLPSALAEALRAGSRTTVLKQRVAVDFRWWNERLAPRGLPGGPISAPDGRSLTRVDVFAERDNPFRLLWLTLAWGSGNRRRLCEKRIGAVCDTSDVAELLAAATTQAAADPVAAFRQRPGARQARDAASDHDDLHCHSSRLSYSRNMGFKCQIRSTRLAS